MNFRKRVAAYDFVSAQSGAKPSVPMSIIPVYNYCLSFPSVAFGSVLTQISFLTNWLTFN